MNSFLTTLIFGFSFAAALLIIARLLHYRRANSRRKRISALRAQFGKPLHRNRDFDVYQQFLMHRDAGNTCTVDDQTWEDLDLNSVFSFIDRTLSTPGEIELHRFLRRVEVSVEVLRERDEAVNFLHAHHAVREQIQLKLNELGHCDHSIGLLELIWDGPLPDTRHRRWFDALGALSVASVFVLVTFRLLHAPIPVFAVAMMIGLFAINMAAHYWSRSRYGYLIHRVRYLSKLIGISGQISRIEARELGARISGLRALYERTKSIPIATRLVLHNRQDTSDVFGLLQEYFSIFFLTEVRSLLKAANAICQCRPDLQRLFVAVGEIDALQAVASFRCEIQDFARPRFSERKQLCIENAVHPLISQPVPNSVSITDKQYLITGSNMSGKSTLLRTVGINAVLAQSIFTCTASCYVGNFFHIMSSITLTDNLLQGKSFYLSEAERLLAMIRATMESTTVLCIIDEALRGTNTTERVAAASSILGYLSRQNAVVIAATHDHELTEILAKNFESHHFTERIDEEGIHFDYQIRPGSPKSTNAIRLLELLGYPKDIVENAADLAS